MSSGVSGVGCGVSSALIDDWLSKKDGENEMRRGEARWISIWRRFGLGLGFDGSSLDLLTGTKKGYVLGMGHALIYEDGVGCMYYNGSNGLGDRNLY